MQKHPETLYLDFENIFTALENSPAYKTLLTVIQKEHISTKEEKAYLACFIVLHNIRCHAVIKSMIEFSKELGQEKFEYFGWLKHALSNPNFLMKSVTPLVFVRWVMYKCLDHTFPLFDTAILINNGSIMVPLSPRMLLEIQLNASNQHALCLERNQIPKIKMEEYRKRVISCTFREIIFHDKATLNEWKNSPEFKRRVEIMSELSSYNLLISRVGTTEIWKLNAFSQYL